MTKPMSAVARRVVRTEPLTGFDRPRRQREVAGAMALSPGREVEGRSILLVDDVFTTGSTVEECSRVLKGKGAAQVVCLVAGRA